ncbi:MAG: L-arabinose isomerase, partial [Planctomycetota bacterium]
MPTPQLDQFEVWLVAGSQHLYGDEALAQVDQHARQIASSLDQSSSIPVRIVFRDVLTGPASIREAVLAANAAPNCIGLLAWMHTFSPAKMWIAGLKLLQKPLAHLHTQFNRDLPWSTIDMDFMNLNQSAHGGREFGFLGARLRARRKVLVGHWQDAELQRDLGVWCRVAAAVHDAQTARFARLGDNMREVAVTEGDKVSAQIELGWSVNGYGVGDLVERVEAVPEASIDELCRQYDASYRVEAALQPGGERRASLRDAARIELGLRDFLEEGRFVGFTDTFEDLHRLKQLPGIAVQRLMSEGYGFGAEGDWKAAAMVRAAKVMAAGLPGGTSFMEDYTYHLPSGDQQVLGAHMLEICPTIAAE